MRIDANSFSTKVKFTYMFSSKFSLGQKSIIEPEISFIIYSSINSINNAIKPWWVWLGSN